MRIAVLVLGILGILLGIIVAGVSLALPELTSNKVDFDEAIIGVVIGVVVLLLSALIAVIGLVLVIMNRKKKT
jgi:hypothetical protein